MTKFSNEFKKPFLSHFGSIFPILGAKKIFLENSALSCTTSGFQHHAIIQKKLMIQFKKNARTDRRMDGGTEGRSDRPYFIGPFWLLQGVQKSSQTHLTGSLGFVQVQDGKSNKGIFPMTQLFSNKESKSFKID